VFDAVHHRARSASIPPRCPSWRDVERRKGRERRKKESRSLVPLASRMVPRWCRKEEERESRRRCRRLTKPVPEKPRWLEEGKKKEPSASSLCFCRRGGPDHRVSPGLRVALYSRDGAKERKRKTPEADLRPFSTAHRRVARGRGGKKKEGEIPLAGQTWFLPLLTNAG